MKSVKTTLPDATTRPPYWPYLNEYHKQHSEAAMEEVSQQPFRSKEEAYAQYDRLAKSRKSAKQPTLLSEQP